MSSDLEIKSGNKTSLYNLFHKCYGVRHSTKIESPINEAKTKFFSTASRSHNGISYDSSDKNHSTFKSIVVGVSVLWHCPRSGEGKCFVHLRLLRGSCILHWKGCWNIRDANAESICIGDQFQGWSLNCVADFRCRLFWYGVKGSGMHLNCETRLRRGSFVCALLHPWLRMKNVELGGRKLEFLPIFPTFPV